MLEKFSVYKVAFSVFNDNAEPAWRRSSAMRYTALVAADNLNDLISQWPSWLLKQFPYTPASGGSHYGEDAIFGTRLEFEEIERIAGSVLFKEDETPGHARLDKGDVHV